MKNIVVIGLGNMGSEMAINLSKNNYTVSGYDINKTIFENLSKHNINEIKNLKEIPKSKIIITMLPNGKIVEKVWDQLLNFCERDTLIIDCSTIDVKTSQRIQKKASSKNMYSLDAPVSGGVIGAKNATLTFMVGGSVDN